MIYDDYSRFVTKCSLEIRTESRGNNSPVIHFNKIMPLLLASYKSKELIYTINNGQIIIAINKIKETENEYIFLWELSNKGVSDPHFNDIPNNTRRKESKKGEEGLGCTVHMIIKKEPFTQNKLFHFFVIEEMVGFGISYVEKAFNFIFKQFSDHFKYVDKETEKQYKSYPKVILNKFASNKLGDVLKKGSLTEISLIKMSLSDELDNPQIKKCEERIKFTLSRTMGQQALDFLTYYYNKYRKKYPTMIIVINDQHSRQMSHEINEKQHSDITIEELAQTPLIEREKIKLKSSIELCQTEFHEELIEKSIEILYK